MACWALCWAMGLCLFSGHSLEKADGKPVMSGKVTEWVEEGTQKYTHILTPEPTSGLYLQRDLCKYN
jgi:hypothetical protein